MDQDKTIEERIKELENESDIQEKAIYDLYNRNLKVLKMQEHLSNSFKFVLCSCMFINFVIFYAYVTRAGA